MARRPRWSLAHRERRLTSRSHRWAARPS
jgi:hypothetical protein